jgi:hypothetical protein
MDLVKEISVPDATIQNVVFQVSAADTDKLRAAWQKAQARYAPELAAKHVDLGQQLEPALDKWAAAYLAFDNLVSEITKQKTLWTSIAPLARAKIKNEARTLQFDAATVCKVSAEYLTAIQSVGDPAEKELAGVLSAIARRAAEHQQRAAITARGR